MTGRPMRDQDAAARELPRLCGKCGGNLARATDLYVVVCGMCGADFTVTVPNDYLLPAGRPVAHTEKGERR